MKFCLQMKYEQYSEFRHELGFTCGYNIVELQDAKNDKESSRPNAWGVKTTCASSISAVRENRSP